MEIFGFPMNIFIYDIFLPFLLFYVLLYALLKKSQVLGNSNTLNSLTSLSISVLAVISLYQLNLIEYSVWISVFLVLASFFVLFGIGTISYSSKKITSFVTGEQFKAEEERNYEKLKSKVKELYEMLSKAKTEKERTDYLFQLAQLIPKLEEYAGKLRKDATLDLPWLPFIKDLIRRIKVNKE